MLLSDLFAHPSRVAAHPIFKDACAIWDFNRETGDRVFDKSIVDRPYHGTYAGTGGSSIARPASKYGRAIQNNNDGTNRRVDLGSITSSDMLSGSPSGEMTLFAHVYYTTAAAGSTWPRIFDKSNGGSGSNGWVANFITTSMQGYAGGQDWSVAHGLTSDQWVTLIWVYKTANNYFYLNGLQLGAKQADTYTFPTTTTNAALLNWNHSTDREWHHTCKHISIWPRVLTAAEIKTLHHEAMNDAFRYTLPIRFPIPSGAAPPAWNNSINEIAGPGAVNEITNANIQSVNEI